MADPAASVPLDVLAFGAHPDDVELCAGGVMCLLAAQGARTGIVDLTRGELGTRGTADDRDREAADAAQILGLVARENLGLPDGDLAPTPDRQRAVVRALRTYRPHIVLLNAPVDRHPDHGNAARLVGEAIFASGLAKVETTGSEGHPQAPWRPHHALHYMQSLDFEPTFVVDVSSVWDQRMEALRAYRSQFYTGEASADAGPQTFISNPAFMAWVDARARTWGYRVGATHGEPLLYRHGPVGVTDLMAVLGTERPFR